MGAVIVNGKNQDIETPVTLIELIRQNNVEKPEMVSVQVNGEFVGRESFEFTEIISGDEVDFLYFMGGGCRC